MALVVYNDGPEVRGLRGMVFARGVPAEVEGEALEKCLRVGFVLAEAQSVTNIDAAQTQALGAALAADEPTQTPRKRKPRKAK